MTNLSNNGTNEVLFTRKQYLNNEVTFYQYYAQFVNKHTINTVLSYFTKEELQKAYKQDKNLNNLKLRIWDNMPISGVSDKMKDAGDYLTLAGKVCILKTAARMIIFDVIDL